MKKIVIGILTATVLFLTIIAGGSGSSSNGGDVTNPDDISLVDAIVFEVDAGDKFDGVKYFKNAKEDIKKIRNSGAFAKKNNDDEATIFKKNDAKDRASAFFLAYYENKSKSPVPKGVTFETYKLADCFLDTALTEAPEDGEYKLSTKDACWKKIEDLYGIVIRTSVKTEANEIYQAIKSSKYNVIGDDWAQNYEENTYYQPGSAEAIALWNQILADHNANPTAIAAGYWGNVAWRQCTSFISWRLWKSVGHGTANGNGAQVAANLVAAYPNEFTLSSTPTAGAVFSTYGTSSAGHVGYVEKVEGDYMWISDGNIGGLNPGGLESTSGIRINYKVNISNFARSHNGAVYAIPIK